MIARNQPRCTPRTTATGEEQPFRVCLSSLIEVNARFYMLVQSLMPITVTHFSFFIVLLLTR